MAKLASLLVDMQLGIASLKQGVDQAKSTLKGLESEVNRIGDSFKTFNALATVGFAKDFVNGIVHATEKVIEFVEHGAELQDQMGKMAQAAGVSTESFSRLTYAARLNNVANEDLGVAFNKLNKHMAEADSGSASAAATFKALGINIKDSSGHMKSTDVVFAEIADKFAGFSDGANKSALALDIFGKAGTRLMPMLNEGSSGLSALGDEAERFGVVVGGEDAKRAQEFEENLKRLKEISDGLAISLANELVPALTDVIKLLTDNSEMIKEDFKDLGNLAAGTGKNILRGIPIIGTMMTGADIIGGAKSWADSQHQSTVDVTIGMPTNLKRTAPGLPNMTVLNEQKSALESLRKVAAGLRAELDAVGGGPIEKLMARLDKGDLSLELKKAGAAGAEMAREILRAGEALLEAQLAAENIKQNFQIARSMGALGTQQSLRRQEYSQIGLTPMSQTLMKTAGFASFDAALQSMAENTQKKLAFEAEAHLREMQGDIEGAAKLNLLADAAGAAAEKANRAADGWSEYSKAMNEAEETLRRRADELGKSIGGMMQKGLEAMFNALGHGRNPEAAAAISGTIAGGLAGTRAGGVINGAMQGGQAGGPWGAVIGAVLSILMESKQFKQIMAVVDEILQMVSDTLGRLLEPLIPVVGAVKVLIGVLTDALQPVLDAFAQAMQGVGPLIMIAAKVLKAITPAMTAFSMAISFAGPLFKFFGEKVMPAIFEALKFVSNIILDIAKAIMDVWNGIIDAVDSVFNSIANIEIFNVKPFAFLKDLLGGLKVPTDGLADAQKELSKMTYKDAEATANAAGGLDKLNDKAAKVNQELTNMPQGFKYQLRAYEAAIAGDASGVGPNSTSGGKASGKAANGEDYAAHVTVHVAGSILAFGDLMKHIRDALSHAAYVQTGSTMPQSGSGA